MEFQLINGAAGSSNGYLKVVLLAGFMVRSLADPSDGELARMLADPGARASAIHEIARSGKEKVRLLLRWAQQPPPGVDEYQLKVGLADAFAELRTPEAMPFLLKNIGLSRTSKVNTWMKTAAVIERELPAANALIRMGPEAARAVMLAYEDAMTPGDRLAAVFVVSQVTGVPGKAQFLRSAIAQASLEVYWAEHALRSNALK